MKRILQHDQVRLDSSRVEHYDHDVFGPVTVFKDVVIARAIVQEYDDGMAYKPGKELLDAFWTVEGRWSISGRHPDTYLIMNRDDIHGRTVNARPTKSLKDPNTGRPMDRGILVDLEVFDSRVAPQFLSDMVAGARADVSIGFSFDADLTPGVVDDEDDKSIMGSKYDYVQRNISIDHVAFGLDAGRCPMPFCGVGADAIRVAFDPLGEYEDFADCVAKNQDKDDPEAYCGSIEQKVKDVGEKVDAPRSEAERAMAHFEISSEEWEQLSEEEKQGYIGRLPERGSAGMKDKIDSVKAAIIEALSGLDDLVEEEYQGNASNETLSERARRFHSISVEEWDLLSDEEKTKYIESLPVEKTRAGGEEMSSRDSEVDEECDDCGDDDEEEVVDEVVEEEVVEEDEEPEEIELPSTEDILRDVDRVWNDTRRITG